MPEGYSTDYIPATMNENRADAIELGPSAGSGLVPPERQQGNIGEDYRNAIKAVVHPDTLKEWHDAGIAYQILPEEQVGIAYMMQTKNSPWRQIRVVKMVRAKRDGEEILMAHVEEEAENELHNRIGWDHLVGVRMSSTFDKEFDGMRIKAARKTNTTPVYYIKWSKEAAEDILKYHNDRRSETHYVLDVTYTSFGSITREDFLNLSYEELHDKYLGGVNYGTAAAQQKLTGQRAFPGGEVTINAPTDRNPATYPGLTTATAEQIARLYASGDDGKRMADNIMSQMPASRAVEIAYAAQKHLEAIKLQQAQGGQIIQEPTTGQTVEVSFPHSGGTAGRIDIAPPGFPTDNNSGGGPMFKNDKVPYKETSGFVTYKHDEKSGKPTHKVTLDKDGQRQEIELNPQEAAKIEYEEGLLKQGIAPADAPKFEEKDQDIKNRGKDKEKAPPNKNTPLIEEIIEDEDDDGNESPLKKKSSTNNSKGEKKE